MIKLLIYIVFVLGTMLFVSGKAGLVGFFVIMLLIISFFYERARNLFAGGTGGYGAAEKAIAVQEGKLKKAQLLLDEEKKLGAALQEQIASLKGENEALRGSLGERDENYNAHLVQADEKWHGYEKKLRDMQAEKAALAGENNTLQKKIEELEGVICRHEQIIQEKNEAIEENAQQIKYMKKQFEAINKLVNN